MAELVYPPIINLARVVFRAQGLRFNLRGTENVPRHGGAVMVINHIGYLDFTYAGLAARPARRLVRFMAKQEVFTHKVSGPLMRGMHHIPVDREAGAGSYRAAVEALRAGEIVGVFPEATISRSFELKDFKAGAARMAAEAGVPLLPTIIWGSQRVWTKGRPEAAGADQGGDLGVGRRAGAGPRRRRRRTPPPTSSAAGWRPCCTRRRRPIRTVPPVRTTPGGSRPGSAAPRRRRTRPPSSTATSGGPGSRPRRRRGTKDARAERLADGLTR